jgi:uncharacterized OB-fold protein
MKEKCHKCGYMVTSFNSRYKCYGTPGCPATQKYKIKLEKEVEDFYIGYGAQSFNGRKSQYFIPFILEKDQDCNNGEYMIINIERADKAMKNYLKEKLDEGDPVYVSCPNCGDSFNIKEEETWT